MIFCFVSLLLIEVIQCLSVYLIFIEPFVLLSSTVTVLLSLYILFIFVKVFYWSACKIEWSECQKIQGASGQ